MNSDDNPSTAPPTEPQPPNASEAARPPDDWVVTTPVEGEVITSLATGNSLRDEFCNGRQRFLRTLRLEMFSDSALARLCGWFRLLAHLWILPEIILTASCPPLRGRLPFLNCAHWRGAACHVAKMETSTQVPTSDPP